MSFRQSVNNVNELYQEGYEVCWSRYNWRCHHHHFKITEIVRINLPEWFL